MTHGHFDHSAGAATLKPMLPNAKFVMSQRGWDEAARSAATSFGRRKWEMIPQDVVMADGETFELGGNSFMLIETPGHTWGTSSYSYNVTDGEDSFRAVTIGGLGLNAIQSPDRVEAYIVSVDRLKTMAEDPDNGVQVHLTTDGFSNNLDEDRLKLASRKPGEPNVFVKAAFGQADETFGFHTQKDHYGQTAFLWCRQREGAPGLEHRSHKGLNNRAKTAIYFSKTRAGDAGFPIAGRLTTLRIYAVCNPKSFLCPSPPPLCPHHPLPSARSIRGVEIRGTCRLINDRHANLQTRRINVTTPHDRSRPCGV